MKQETTRAHMPDFYDRMETHPDVLAALKSSRSRVPSDWYLLMTDVEKSSQAVQEGRYKQINIAGALPIIALARMYDSLKRPFVFGGDGMTFLIGPEKLDEAKTILARVVRDVNSIYGLNIRAAAIPLSRIEEMGGSIELSKIRVSPHYVQAYFFGTGVALAESILKNPGKEDRNWFIAAAEDDSPNDYEGFTCRWADVPSHTGITAALIVEPTSLSGPEYILHTLEECLGHSGDYHPLRVENMKMGGKQSSWTSPILVRTRGRKNLLYYLLLMKGWIEIRAVRMAIQFKIPLKMNIYKLDEVREQNIENSDFRKFEGALKMIFATDSGTIERLRSKLEKELMNGRLFYGLHLSDRAHMTCIATLESGDDVHFLDAAEGGYTMAALQLKEQKKSRQIRMES